MQFTSCLAEFVNKNKRTQKSFSSCQSKLLSVDKEVLRFKLLFELSVAEQHYVSIFFTRVYGLWANLCFSSTRVVWWLINKSVIFLLSRFIFACRLVLYLYACAVENPEIPGFCVSKSRGLRKINRIVDLNCVCLRI